MILGQGAGPQGQTDGPPSPHPGAVGAGKAPWHLLLGCLVPPLKTPRARPRDRVHLSPHLSPGVSAPPEDPEASGVETGLGGGIHSVSGVTLSSK